MHETTRLRLNIYIYDNNEICLFACMLYSAFALEVTSKELETSNKYQLFKEEWHYKIILLLILHEVHLANLSDPSVVGKKV